MSKLTNVIAIALITFIPLSVSPLVEAKAHSHGGYKQHHKKHKSYHHKRHNHKHKRHHHRKYRHKHRHNYWYGDFHHHNVRRHHYCAVHGLYHLNHSGHHIGSFLGGIALGAIVNDALNDKHDNNDRHNNYEYQNQPQVQQPPVIYRQKKNGKCFQVFYDQQGNENLVPVAKSFCGG